MNKTKNAKIFIEAAIVIAVTLALIMPASAVITNNVKNTYGFERIDNQDNLKKQTTTNTFAGDDTWATPFQGDDYIPAITKDLDDNVVITWTNEQSFSESYFGLSHSNDPTDDQTWYDNGLVLTITGNDFGFDTALIEGPEADDYKGLVGVFYSLLDDVAGYYEIEDITGDYGNWPIYSWSDFGQDSYYACISDGGFVQGGYYPDMFGPMAFHICLNDLCGTITECPVFIHIDIRNDGGGVMFYDCQEDEQTAPAADPDYFMVVDREIYHTIVFNHETNSVIWKKVDPTIEHDYEYTPFQETIGTGTNPAIAGYGTNVAVVYTDEGQVKCTYSSDDGETWDTSTVASGGFPDICAVGTVLYATYISGGNLFKVSSEDGGATWSQAEQVNDVDGTVVAMENSVDIHEAGIVWVDERGEDWDIYYDELVSIPQPKIEIDQIAGGIGVSAVVTNNGDAAATNVDWSITLDGTVFLGAEKTGTISNLGIGDSEPIKSGFPLGFGPIDITITAKSAEGPSATETASGTLLLFFITGL
jgi:hypothetical protein